MAYTSSSLESDGTPAALIHSNSTLPVSREEDNQIIDDAKENDRFGASKEDWVVADAARDDATAKSTAEERGESSDPRTTKSEPSLVAYQNMENVSEEVEKKNSSTSEQAIPNDVVTVSAKTLIHSGVSQVKSEPSLIYQSAKTDSKVEAEDIFGDNKEKILPYTEASPSGHTTTTAPLHADTTPPAQIDQSARTSPNGDVGQEGGIGNLQPVGGNDGENSQELAPFPQLQTLSLVNNLVSKSLC
jgi:hypothetical protein